MSDHLLKKLTSTVTYLKEDNATKVEKITSLTMTFAALNEDSNTKAAEIDHLATLVTALRQEKEVAHQLLAQYTQLLSSSKVVMERRLPMLVKKDMLVNKWDKVAIAVMVAKLDELQDERET